MLITAAHDLSPEPVVYHEYGSPDDVKELKDIVKPECPGPMSVTYGQCSDGEVVRLSTSQKKVYHLHSSVLDGVLDSEGHVDRDRVEGGDT